MIVLSDFTIELNSAKEYAVEVHVELKDAGFSHWFGTEPEQLPVVTKVLYGHRDLTAVYKKHLATAYDKYVFEAALNEGGEYE